MSLNALLKDVYDWQDYTSPRKAATTRIKAPKTPLASYRSRVVKAVSYPVGPTCMMCSISLETAGRPLSLTAVPVTMASTTGL